MWLLKTDCLLLKMMLVKQSYHFLSQYLCLLLALLSPSYLLVQGGDRKREKSVFWAFFIYETLKERLSSINSSYNVFTAEKKVGKNYIIQAQSASSLGCTAICPGPIIFYMINTPNN